MKEEAQKTARALTGREWMARLDAAFEDRPKWVSEEEAEHKASGDWDEGEDGGPEAGYPEALINNTGSVEIRGKPDTIPCPEEVQEITMCVKDAVSFAKWILATFPEG